MGAYSGPKIVSNNLALALDSANLKGLNKYKNLAYNSEDLNLWTNNTSNLPSITVTPNSVTAPNETLTADVLSQSAATGASRWVASLIDYNYVSGVTYTLSVWLKKVSGTDAQPTISLWVNDFTQQSVGTITTGWVRYSATFTAASTSNVNTFTGLNVDWDGNGAANNFTFAAWGFQLEIGSSATDYYKTNSTGINKGAVWKDLSGKGNTTTLTNEPIYNGDNEGSLVFDGVDDYAQINGSITVSQATFIAWIKRNGNQPSYAGIVYSRVNPSSGNATGLDLSGIDVIANVYNPINQVNYTWNGAGNTWTWDTGLLIPDFTWCMCAVSVKSTSATAYLCQPSGITSSTNVVNHSPATLGNIKIGVDDVIDNDEERFFKGDIGQASIYNRALTASEIQQIYIATKSRYDTVEDYIVTSGLVLNLDAGNIESYPRTGTTWTDLSGSGNNGTLTNGPTFSSSNGGSIVFDGTNDYVSLSPSTRYTTLTMEVWFNTTTISLERQYLYTQQTNPPTLTEFTYQQRQGCQISYDKVTFQYLNTDNTSFYVDTTPSIQPNTWYQFVAVLNGSSYQLYLNGSPVSMTPNILINQYVNTNTNSKVFTPNQAYIGLRGDIEGDDRFNGKISVVREYNRALTASEIKYNFNVTRSRYGI